MIFTNNFQRGLSFIGLSFIGLRSRSLFYRHPPFLYHTKMVEFEYFHVLSIFSSPQKSGINSEKCIKYANSKSTQIDKPQRGRPKRAELLDVNINTGMQSINTERANTNLDL